MTPKAFRIAFPRKSRLGVFFSIAISLSLLTPLAPAAVGAGGSASPHAYVAPAAAPVFAFAPTISATKSDAFPDPDNDGRAAPGDTITYTVQIGNGGTDDATGVVFNDTVDPNTTLVPGSVTTTPVARNDGYAAVGNVRINVPAANGVTANDSDPDGDSLTATAGATSTQGGDVSMNPDGSFTYNPPAGFEGADSFTYSVTDGDGPADTATVNVNVSGMVWFVDDSAAAGGDGRLTSPFNALTGPGSFDAVAADDQNDNIFLHSGTYTGGLALKSGQALIGQGSAASLETVAGLSPLPPYSQPLPATGGADPVVGGASGISVATNNLIRGLTIANTAGAGISGTAFGTLAVADTTLNSTAQALNLDNGVLDAQFDAVNVGGRTSTGLLLNAVGGTAAFGPTSIPNPLGNGGYGIRVQNSSADITFAGAVISNSNQVFGQVDANVDGVPDSEGDGDAISLVNNTGSFTLNGGTLSNCGNNCVAVRDSQNLTLSGVTISTPGVNVSAAAGAGIGGHGVQAINLTGANFITGSTVTQFNGNSREGVRFVNTVPTPSTLTVTGSTFSNATGANGILINGRDAAQMSLTVGGPTNNPATNCTFTGLRGTAVNHTAGFNAGSTATVDVTVRNSTFQNAPVGGLNTASARTLNGGRANVVFKGNTFETVAQTGSSNTGAINVTGGGTLPTNLLSVSVQGNTLNNVGSAANVGLRGIQVVVDASTNVSGTVVVDSNTLTNVRRDGLFLDFANGVNGSDVNARVTNNTVGTDAARVGQAGQSGLRVFRRCTPVGSQCGRSANVLVEGNSIRNGSGAAANVTNGAGLFARSEDNASLTLTVLNNDIETSSTGPAEENSTTSFPVGVGSSMCLDMGGSGAAGQANTLASGAGLISLTEGAGTALNVEQASAAALASANGIPAGNVTLTGSPQFGVACAAPPVATFRTNAGGVYLASLTSPSANSFGLFAGLLSLDGWRAGARSRLGLSLSYAAGGVALGSGLGDTVVRPAREAASFAPAYAPAPPFYSGETVSLNIGTLPAGKSMTITFQATINNPLNATQVSNQGTVSGGNFAPVPTDDPATGAFGDPTVTQVGVPATISCPADINVNTDAGQFSASVAFAVTATGTPNPTVDCKVGATSITSPHTFPVGTTAVQCTATNGVGAPASCSFNVTVNDNQAPVVNCPPNVAVNAAPNSCDASVDVGTPSVVDNEPGVTAVGTRSDTQPLNAPYPVGTTTITWTATDAAGNSGSCQQTVTVADATAPVITLNGPAATTVECHNSFADPGATASDNCGGSVPVTATGSVNVNVPGTYTITYNAADAAGNAAAPVTRTVTVVDTTQPVVSLNGAADVTVECHTSYSDAGASAQDSCAGSLPVSVSGSVNANVVGDYTLTYTATDASGNTGTATRVVHVRDTTAPAVSLNGANPLTVVQGSAFVDPGATAADSCGGPLPVNVSGSVNTGAVGTYTLTYTATDASGNTGTATRTVFVVYNFNGFFSPVNNPPVLNEVKAGQNIPLKFSLNGYKGMAIFAPGYPASQQVSCANNVPINVLEETGAAGNSSLTYDAGSDRYHYNWKTEKSWAGTCRVLVVKLSDGTTHTANFKFK